MDDIATAVVTPAARVDAEQQFIFVLRISSFGGGDAQHVNEVATHLSASLHRTFPDRYEMWHDNVRIRFDPLALDGEHEGHTEVLTIEPLDPDADEHWL